VTNKCSTTDDPYKYVTCLKPWNVTLAAELAALSDNDFRYRLGRVELSSLSSEDAKAYVRENGIRDRIRMEHMFGKEFSRAEAESEHDRGMEGIGDNASQRYCVGKCFALLRDLAVWIVRQLEDHKES